VRGEETTASVPAQPGYHSHLEAANRLLRSGRGADAVPELARALELGGDEAREAINQLLTLNADR
jgi:ATP-dependent DNA helicase RecQ